MAGNLTLGYPRQFVTASFFTKLFFKFLIAATVDDDEYSPSSLILVNSSQMQYGAFLGLGGGGKASSIEKCENTDAVVG